MRKKWLPLAELPKPKLKSSIEAILAGLGPITTLGQKIRYFRIKNLFNQGELAKKLGVGTPAVSQWEGGKTLPNARHLKHLSRVLQVPVE